MLYYAFKVTHPKRMTGEDKDHVFYVRSSPRSVFGHTRDDHPALMPFTSKEDFEAARYNASYQSGAAESDYTTLEVEWYEVERCQGPVDEGVNHAR